MGWTLAFPSPVSFVQWSWSSRSHARPMIWRNTNHWWRRVFPRMRSRKSLVRTATASRSLPRRTWTTSLYTPATVPTLRKLRKLQPLCYIKAIFPLVMSTVCSFLYIATLQPLSYVYVSSGNNYCWSKSIQAGWDKNLSYLSLWTVDRYVQLWDSAPLPM